MYHYIILCRNNKIMLLYGNYISQPTHDKNLDSALFWSLPGQLQDTLVAKMTLENPCHLGMIVLEDDK